MQRNKTMTHRQHSKPLITNEATLRRRAWIEQAVAGVRGRLGGPIPDERPEPPKRHLFLVDNGRSR